jgi:hypothetical protein
MSTFSWILCHCVFPLSLLHEPQMCHHLIIVIYVRKSSFAFPFISLPLPTLIHILMAGTCEISIYFILWMYTWRSANVNEIFFSIIHFFQNLTPHNVCLWLYVWEQRRGKLEFSHLKSYQKLNPSSSPELNCAAIVKWNIMHNGEALECQSDDTNIYTHVLHNKEICRRQTFPLCYLDELFHLQIIFPNTSHSICKTCDEYLNL